MDGDKRKDAELVEINVLGVICIQCVHKNTLIPFPFEFVFSLVMRKISSGLEWMTRLV